MSWPRFGPETGGLDLNGHTNAVPDLVGPVDGSAKLTIMTEGNQFPVLLPLVQEELPKWCARTGACDLSAEDILIVTLPQYMVVRALESGSIRLGNAVVPLVNGPGRVYPDVVMAGAKPLKRLARAGVINGSARVVARHRGLGLLLTRDAARSVTDLEALANFERPLVVATLDEAGARKQYIDTLDGLLNPRDRARIMAREIDFPGRLKIQHRDVPFALLGGFAEAGILFGHLARFYAEAYPADLVAVTVDDAAAFGQDIAIAQSAKGSEIGRSFETFLFEHAATAYREKGYADASSFGFGAEVNLFEP
ncbi:MAG: substrate-binding domain-containing protein [Myxococcota bacterium]